MKEVVLSKPFSSEEEYFAFEEKSELKHEYINSILFEMSAASISHNKMERWFVYLLETALETTGYEVLGDGFKVRTPDGNFFCPDIIVNIPNTKSNYTDTPILIVEIFTDSTKVFDFVDKYVLYRNIPSLQYYVCLEPEKMEVFFYYRMENDEWQVQLLALDEDIINLPKLGITLQLKDIYQS